MAIKIDGVRVKLVASDIDGDGITGEVESVHTHSDKGVMQFKESTELGEVLDYQTRDVENQQRMSSIDFISNINSFQHAPIVAVEFLCSVGVISRKSRGVTRIFKRNAVSVDAMGRKQNVEVAVGKREQDIRKAGMHNLVESQRKE